MDFPVAVLWPLTFKCRQLQWSVYKRGCEIKGILVRVLKTCEGSEVVNVRYCFPLHMQINYTNSNEPHKT